MVPLHTLEKLGFFEGLPPEYLKPLVGVAKVIEVKAGEIIFNEGQNSPNIYSLIEGKVALETWVAGRGATIIQTVGPGKLLGWTPLLTQGLMTATARAVEPSRLVAINAIQAQEACAQNPKLGMEIMRRTALALAKRLNATRMHLLEAYEDTLPVVSE
jgi:CRP/FNR family transcriptional regulator, cyclic AMP receptor protein